MHCLYKKLQTSIVIPGKSLYPVTLSFKAMNPFWFMIIILYSLFGDQIFHSNHVKSSILANGRFDTSAAGVLVQTQFGFRASHSCSDLLLATLDDWLQARDKKQYTTAVFIDLSKAFDNVLHEHLLLTLQACGISGTALRWFRNFLYDRQQRVVVNNKSSSFFMCNKGVPQGSVLGPLLFNIYVADLPSLAREHGAKMPSFADDMTLYCSHTSAALACSSVSAALKDTSRALALRGLSINVSKTVAMVIAPHSRACQGLASNQALPALDTSHATCCY